MASDQQPLHQKDSAAIHSPDNKPPSKNNCNGYCCYKFLVVTYGIFFFIIGLALLGIGLWVVSVKQSFDSINDFLTSPSILAIIVGICMIIFSLLGILGALKEKLVLLKIFLAIVIIVFLLQVVIGILAFVYREETINVAEKQLKFGIEYYTTNRDVRSAVDVIQKHLDCCGLKGPSSWDYNEDYKCGGGGNFSCAVPDSCCKEYSEGCGGQGRGSSVAQQMGCTEVFSNWVENHLDITGACALGFALLHVLGIFLVYMFITKVEDRHLLFKYRKRFYES